MTPKEDSIDELGEACIAAGIKRKEGPLAVIHILKRLQGMPVYTGIPKDVGWALEECGIEEDL